MKYIFTVLSLLALSHLACGQGYGSIEHLFLRADEILVVKIVDEKTASESYMTCNSRVTAEIEALLKVTRLKSDTGKIHFIRILRCAEGSMFPPERILDKGKRYILFLSSINPGYDLINKHDLYPLTDYILGIQEYTEDLFRYIQNKQREKH